VEAVMEAAMEAVVESEVTRPECRVRCKGCTCETRAGEIRAAKARPCAHCAEMRPAGHTASHGMHPHCSAAHAAGMATKAAAAHAAAMAAKAAATAKTTSASTACERWWRKRERRTERARNETTEKLASHRIPPFI
jgi:hypothetical protein